jgi:LuxR family maltose regulon positive regulatory protein
MQGDFVTTVKYAEMSLQLTPESDLFQRSQANVTLGFSNWATGNLEAALKAMSEWMDNMQKTGNVIFVVASAFALADILIALGRLTEAEATLNRSLELASTQGDEAEKITAHHYLILALIAFERCDKELFSRRLQKAQKLGELTTLVDWPYRWNLAQALIKEGEKDCEAALKLLDEAQASYVLNPIPDSRPIEALKTRIYLKQGRFDKIQAWVQKTGFSTSDEINYMSEFEHLVLARVRIANRDFSGIDDMLERMLKTAESQNRLQSVLEILLALFQSHLAQGNQDQAIKNLNQALVIAETEGYTRLFMDEGDSLRSSLETLSKDRDHPQQKYITRLLFAFSQSDIIPSKSKIDPRQTGLVEPLTERELEILRLVAQGLSNTEISQRLFLALSTIKGHNLRIFTKLQVQNRTEAVASARDLGLL